MLPGFQPSAKTIMAVVVMVVLGLFLVSAFGDKTMVAYALFGFTFGFLLLGFGVAVMVAAIVRSRRDYRLTPRTRIAAGTVLVVVGFVVGLLTALTPLTTLQAFVIAQSVTWVLIIIALVLLVFRQSEGPVATGIALVAIAPMVWVLLMLTPIRGVFILPFLVAGMIAVYGIFVALFGLADRRPEAAQ